MRWQIELRASEQPESWEAVRKPGGSSLFFEDVELAEQRLQEMLKVQPHMSARVRPMYGEA